jgi:hypothetical protein
LGSSHEHQWYNVARTGHSSRDRRHADFPRIENPFVRRFNDDEIFRNEITKAIPDAELRTLIETSAPVPNGRHREVLERYGSGEPGRK